MSKSLKAQTYIKINNVGMLHLNNKKILLNYMKQPNR